MIVPLILASIMSLQTGTPQRSREKGIVVQGEKLIRIWLNVVDRAATEGFIDVERFDALPDRVRGGSSLWSERFLQADADPHHQKREPKVSIHLATDDTPDLLRYEYVFQSWRLTLFESNNFTIVRVNCDSGFLDQKDGEIRTFIESAAHAILNQRDEHHTWTFQLPPELGEGVLFSTAPNVDPLYLPAWTDRADGGIHQGNLFFLCYKKVLDNALYDDIKNWFDGDYRAKMRR